MPPPPTGIPAGLANLRTMEITGMGATMFEDTRYGFFSLGMPTESWGTFALSGIFTTSGEFERATWDEDLDETFSEKESVVSLGWAGSFKRFPSGRPSSPSARTSAAPRAVPRAWTSVSTTGPIVC